MDNMKPLIRGYVHLAGFVIAIFASLFLIIHSYGSHALAANLVYSISLVGMYAISALYHYPMWSRRVYLLLRRIDHAAIYFFIAGTATPICLFGIKGQKGLQFLIILWTFALIGIFMAIFWSHGPKWMRAFLYLAIGWIGIFYLPEMKSGLGAENMRLLLIGGILFTIGALIYGFKHPNPFPKVFGYHEIFHILVVIASGFYFFIIYNL